MNLADTSADEDRRRARQVWGIVLAAGVGRRYGGAKQFAFAAGARLVDWAVASTVTVCTGVVVVVPAGEQWVGMPVAAWTTGGPTRLSSVRKGLARIPADAEIVVVHDAAHPVASPPLVGAVVQAVVDGADAAVPVVPVRETLKRVDGDRVLTVPNEGVVVTQMPHAFRAEILRAVHRAAPDAVEDSMLVEAVGGRIATVPGEPANIHVTTNEELAVADMLLAARPSPVAGVH